ncbi:PAS domain S-box protein [Halorubrum cibi]|uniref:PAS domain S-box-containing protein n=1 Tax=Halorubrum cibi TaxID=413815 RepID=A0A521B724_9EURY|nr:PAS domain S-box protein [Halorubrum cibi]SMO42904.1 PAS domain S-box-containing protein [Halorubrum cibi]
MPSHAPADRPDSFGDGFFESFVEGSSDPVISLDEEGTVVYASPAVESVLEHAASDLSGRRLASLVPETTAEKRDRSIRARLDDPERLVGEGDVTVPLASADGSAHSFSVRFHDHEVDGRRVYTGSFRERTESDRGRELRTFRNLIEQAGHAIYVTDTDGTIEYVNPAFTEHTGYEAEEAIGETPAILNSGEMSDEYFESLWETIRTGEVWEEEIVDRRKDGEQYHAHQTIAPVLDDAGTVSRFVAIQTDITERKAAVGRLKQYRDIVEQLDEPILLQDRDGEFELLNEAVSEFAGVSREELYGDDEFAFMNPETAATIDDRRREVLETEETAEYEVSPTFERSEREATFSTRRYPYYDEDGELSGTFAICRDVTDIKSRERELERFERAIDGATDLIAAVDREGQFLFANRQYRTYHGIDETDVSGLTVGDVVDADQFPDVKRHVDRALRGHSIEYRTTRTHPDRGTRTFDVRYYPLEASDEDREGEVVGVVGVLRDVTDSENRSRQLRVVDRVLQHNLRNAMTVIRGRAEQIADGNVRGYDSPEDGSAGPADPADAASDIVSRADELLTTSEKAHHITEVLSDPPTAERVDVGRTVDQLVEATAAEFPNASVSASTPAAGEAIASATGWIDRAIRELIHNAIVHHDRDRQSVEVAVESTAEAVVIRVVDDGPGLNGMNRDVLETGRAVDALYHGSGLGLWLVYWVLQQSGGSATAADAEPRGTVVTVTLPRREDSVSGS